MRGKEKCRELKEIRRKIAEANDIEYVVSECKHQGDCKGTCPKCEAELLYLERELKLRQAVGKTVAVVGVSAGVAMTMSGCVVTDAISNVWNSETGGSTLSGEVEYVQTEGDMMELPPDSEECPSGECTTEECNSENCNPEDYSNEDCSCEECDSKELTSEDTYIEELEGDVVIASPEASE